VYVVGAVELVGLARIAEVAREGAVTAEQNTLRLRRA
jgi:hypothetical protein